MLRNRKLARLRRTIFGLAVLVVAVAAVGVVLWVAGRSGSGARVSGANSTNWGPLAVVAFDTGAQALSAGTLHITDMCVVLEEAGNDPSVLVWHDTRTRWQADAREIVFQNRNGRDVTLRDGEQVTFAGGGDSVAEGGLPGDEWIAGIDWVSKPDPACPNESRWFVNQIVVPR